MGAQGLPTQRVKSGNRSDSSSACGSRIPASVEHKVIRATYGTKHVSAPCRRCPPTRDAARGARWRVGGEDYPGYTAFQLGCATTPVSGPVRSGDDHPRRALSLLRNRQAPVLFCLVLLPEGAGTSVMVSHAQSRQAGRSPRVQCIIDLPSSATAAPLADCAPCRMPQSATRSALIGSLSRGR